MVSNQYVDCPSTIKSKSFAELVLCCGMSSVKGGYQEKEIELDLNGVYISTKDLRVWVEDEIKSTMKEMKSFASMKDVNWFAGRIFVLEKMLEGLK
jgi:hypothetical protein